MFRNRTHARRRAVTAAATLAAAAALTTAAVTPAHAASAFTIHITPNSSFGLLLDVNGGSTAPGTGVIQWYANGGANQNWTFVPAGGGTDTYEIVNGNSNQCLTTDGVAGDDVYQFPCLGAQTQLWSTNLTPWTTYAWTIQNPYSGLVLDVNGASPWAGAHLDVWYYNGGSNQFFAAL